VGNIRIYYFKTVNKFLSKIEIFQIQIQIMITLQWITAEICLPENSFKKNEFNYSKLKYIRSILR